MSLSADVHNNGQRINLLDLTITTALPATATTPIKQFSGSEYLAVEAIFTYGSGGTSAKAYVQTTLDGGVTWIDIMSFAFAGVTASKVSAVVYTTALAPAITPTDGTLADNTILSGLLGSQIRVKYVTTGTYAGGTTLALDAVIKG